MGAVITFPGARRPRRDGQARHERGTATVIILPVVRIERAAAVPSDSSQSSKTSSGRRRRRPASRS